MKPTVDAESKLNGAIYNFSFVQAGNAVNNALSIALGLKMLAYGLKSMNVGLRATYAKLEDIEAQLTRQNGSNRNRP